MNADTLLKKLHRERLEAVNTVRYVPVRKCPAFVRRAHRDLLKAQRVVERARRELTHAGYHPNTHATLRVVGARALAARVALGVAHQRASIDLLKCTAPPQRAAVIERFIAATKDLVK